MLASLLETGLQILPQALQTICSFSITQLPVVRPSESTACVVWLHWFIVIHLLA